MRKNGCMYCLKNGDCRTASAGDGMPSPAAYIMTTGLFHAVAYADEDFRAWCRVEARQFVILVGDIVPARQHRPVAGELVGGVQIDQAISAQDVLVGGIIETLARQLPLGARRQRTSRVVDGEVGVLLGAAYQLLVLGFIARVLQVDVAADVESAELACASNRQAFQQRLVDVVGAAVAGEQRIGTRR